MARPLHSVEWSESNLPQQFPHHRDRCFNKRVGGSVRRGMNRGTMDCGRTSHAHIFSGTAGSTLGNQVLYQTQNKYQYHTEDGQYVSVDIHQQIRGNDIPTSQSPGQATMVMVYGEEYPPQSSTSAGCLQHHSRQRVEDHERQVRLKTLSSDISQNQSEYVSWRPYPMAMTTDAFTMDWAQIRGYANPPWSFMGRVMAQTHKQQAELVLVAPVWKAQVWYPVLLDMLVDIPLLISQREDLIQPTHSESHQEAISQLAVWTISGSDKETVKFRRKPKSSSWHGTMEAKILQIL